MSYRSYLLGSSALCRILQLLSTNQDLQTRLRDEIVEARKANGGNDLSYQAIDDLQILSAVIRETLRLYPPVPHIPRRYVICARFYDRSVPSVLTSFYSA